MSNGITHSVSWETSKPFLSVLIPFYRDDASDLFKDLETQAKDLPIEVLIQDDGSGDPALTSRMEGLVESSSIAARLYTAPANQGRSATRNDLQNAARSEWVLFLDADMRPASERFLSSYLNLVMENSFDIIFGGFEVEARQSDKDRDLHRALSEVSDCLSLAERQAAGAQYVASSNLCVRKSVLTEEPFDNKFSGWGWEDSEWAARVSKSYSLVHADNPAIHLGLETTDTLLKRFATSGENYRRFVTLHPELAQQLSLYRISLKLGQFPGQKIMRPLLRMIVKAVALPMRLRLMALKLWRASHYAEVLS